MFSSFSPPMVARRTCTIDQRRERPRGDREVGVGVRGDREALDRRPAVGVVGDAPAGVVPLGLLDQRVLRLQQLERDVDRRAGRGAEQPAHTADSRRAGASVIAAVLPRSLDGDGAGHAQLPVAGHRAGHRVLAGREVDLELLALAAEEGRRAGELLGLLLRVGPLLDRQVVGEVALVLGGDRAALADRDSVRARTSTRPSRPSPPWCRPPRRRWSWWRRGGLRAGRIRGGGVVVVVVAATAGAEGQQRQHRHQRQGS